MPKFRMTPCIMVYKSMIDINESVIEINQLII